MSITAFPVLARILTDRGMHRTSTGVRAGLCGGRRHHRLDVCWPSWLSSSRGNGPLDVLRINALTGVFAGVMFWFVRPAPRRPNDWYARAGRLTPDTLAVLLIGALVSAYITEIIGSTPFSVRSSSARSCRGWVPRT